MTRKTPAVSAATGLALLLAACQGQPAPSPTAPQPPTAVPSEPAPAGSTAPPAPQAVEIAVDLGYAPASLDPAYVTPLDSAGGDLVDSLFAGLTALNPDTGYVEPQLARSWELSEDRLTWTVFLRDDVFWVQVDPDAGMVERVRPVTAGDVVYAVRRACRSEPAAPLASALFVIQGCREAYSLDPAAVTAEAIAATVGVRVLNDVAVEFKLVRDAAYFPTLMAMPLMRPVPADLLDSAGEAWTEAGTIMTSGPYALEAGSAAEGYTLIANPHLTPARVGNVERIRITFDPGSETAFSAWETGSLAASALPPSQISRFPFGDDPAYWLLAQPAVTLLAASYDTPPLDNAALRRALALALDRQVLIDEILEPAGLAGLPAYTLSPPGTAAAPPYGEVRALTDPDAARAALAEAGYPGCAGLPAVSLLVDDSALSLALATRIVQMWDAALGCGTAITVEQAPLQEVLIRLHETPDVVQRQFRPPRPGLILLSWQADYPDAHHWLADIAGCRDQFPDAYLNSARPCLEADALLAEAAITYDTARRAELYKRIDAAFFGPRGEMPVIPIIIYARGLAFQPGVEFAPLRAGSLRFDRWMVAPLEEP